MIVCPSVYRSIYLSLYVSNFSVLLNNIYLSFHYFGNVSNRLIHLRSCLSKYLSRTLSIYHPTYHYISIYLCPLHTLLLVICTYIYSCLCNHLTFYLSVSVCLSIYISVCLPMLLASLHDMVLRNRCDVTFALINISWNVFSSNSSLS
jgi:hypothetical protein